MPTITTYSGLRMNPVEPHINDIDIRDIAHALSLVCRGGGHVTHFYSVAQHCMVCAEEAKARGCSTRVQLGALLHDGSEAYMSDLVRPVKLQIPQYRVIEDRLIETIWAKFIPGDPLTGQESGPLSDEERRIIRNIDDDVMSWDMKILLGDEINENYRNLRTMPDHSFVPMNQVERAFLLKFDELRSGLNV